MKDIVIKRDLYLNKLISKMHNGRIKIITGIRRCGKSYLLSRLFKDHMLSHGAAEDQIIEIGLDKKEFDDLRDPNLLYRYILDRVDGSKNFYIFNVY